MSNKEEWENKLKEVKSYIDINNKRPLNQENNNLSDNKNVSDKENETCHKCHLMYKLGKEIWCSVDPAWR
jgi:hypothetical protein